MNSHSASAAAAAEAAAAFVLTPNQLDGWAAIPNEKNTLVLDFPGMTEMPVLPPEVPVLKVLNTDISSYTHAGVKTHFLYLEDNLNLTTISGLPEGLTSLFLRNLPCLTKIDSLPSTLSAIFLNDCHSLTRIPDLPGRLTTFSMHGCNKITHIPCEVNKKTLPALGFFSVRLCNSLVVPARAKKTNSLFKYLIEAEGMELLLEDPNHSGSCHQQCPHFLLAKYSSDEVFYQATLYALDNPGEPLDDPFSPAYRAQWDEYYAM